MALNEIQTQLIPIIETQLKTFLSSLDFGESQVLKQMLNYHMVWEDDNGSRGKRIRPFLTMLTAGAWGSDPKKAVHAAIAVEFLHNFTLIHDDIEDKSLIRHARPTIWKKWGLAQAVNAGDALFSIAQLAMLNVNNAYGEKISLEAIKAFNQTCLHLTRGQYLDIAFETAKDIATSAYMDMIEGKTAALISFSAFLGGLLAEKKPPTLKMLSQYGKNLGLAFQIQDDFLGVWGDPKLTGKSASSDLLNRKKTLPIIFGLQNCKEFQQLWGKNKFSDKNVILLVNILTECGAQKFVQTKAEHFTELAFTCLDQLAFEDNPYSRALRELTETLLSREI